MSNEPPAEDVIPAEEVALYVAETRALLTQARDWIEENDAVVDVDALMRVFHTIKGNAGFFYFTKSRVLAHAIEELLVGVRDAGWQLDAERRETLRLSVATLMALTNCIDRQADEDAVDTSGSWSQLRRAMDAAKSEVESGAEALQTSRASPVQSERKASAADSKHAADRASTRPVRPLYLQLARFASALANDIGMRIDVQLECAEFSMDGNFLASLRQCMLHLIRNALVHGIETSAERLASGKSPTGNLYLRMERLPRSDCQDVQWRFEHADDGRGIDLQTLKARAVARGIVSSEEAQNADDAQVLRWMWLPGVSTAASVTEMAGRGVGLDFVQHTTRTLGGSVEVMSQPGHGTRFALRFPESICLGKQRVWDEP